MPDPTFYEDDGITIMDGIIYMMEHSEVKSMILKLEGNKEARVYWTDKSLCIDIRGLKI